MRIICPTAEDFIANLTDAAGLLEGTIWCSTVRGPGGENKREAVVFNVIFQASAVVVTASGAEYLVDFGLQCGDDYEDAMQEREGTTRADEVRQLIADFAKGKGWRVLPGIIDGA